MTTEDLAVARAALLLFGSAALIMLIPRVFWALYLLNEMRKARQLARMETPRPLKSLSPSVSTGGQACRASETESAERQINETAEYRPAGRHA